jgi:para-nitrobenzyl esterase
MARKLAIALLVLVSLAGAGVWWARQNLVATPPAPAELARIADPSSVRTLPGGGELVGYAGRYGSHVWLGIPYAQPPVGERRWRAPEAPIAWSGTREALAFGNRCPQFASPFAGVSDVPTGAITGSEDCLFLNVYAPRLERGAAAQAKLPVMVWIHGGGNVIGLSDFYDGGRIAQTHDVVVVTINYRLGPLGWFRHAALREGATPAEQSGNFATLDLVRALEWVRGGIAAFGGDPGNVTIFGESAGGTNVFTLLLSPLASGLFHRAVVESGGTDMDSPASAEHFHDDAEPGHPRSSNEVLTRLLVADGKAVDLAAAKAQLASLPPAEIASLLRTKTPEQLFAAYEREPDEGLLDIPTVFADGVVLPTGDPLERLARPDGWNRVPVIAGTNHDENKLFLFVNPAFVTRWFGVVPQVKEPSLFQATADAQSAMWKATGADRPAAAMWNTQPNVFVYRFDWDEEPTLLGINLGAYLGAAHGFEIPFVFGHWDLGQQGNVIYNDANRAGREALAEQMMSYWANFAWTGDPGRGRKGDQPAWSAWDGLPGAHKYMILDTQDGGGSRMGSEPVTRESVIASVDADPRLTSQRDRCFVYRELARWSRDFTEAEYATAGHEGCAPYPFETFPWN